MVSGVSLATRVPETLIVREFTRLVLVGSRISLKTAVVVLSVSCGLLVCLETALFPELSNSFSGASTLRDGSSEVVGGWISSLVSWVLNVLAVGMILIERVHPGA
jgi:hypothetical protein